MRPAYYVLMVFGEQPCPLHLEPKTAAEAERAINWQCVGQGRRDEYAVTTYDPTSQTFKEAGIYHPATHRYGKNPAPREFKLTEPCIYTEEAFTRFLASLPKEP